MAQIRIVTAEDAATVVALLQGDNPAGLWSERHIAAAIAAKHEYWRIDDDGPYLCRVIVNHEMPAVAVVYLLPETAQAALLPVFKAAMLAAADAEPEALDYPTRGDFYTQQRLAGRTKALAYRQLFAGSLIDAPRATGDGRWMSRIKIARFGDAVDRIRTWQV